MSNRIDVIITESPIVNAATPQLANITNLVNGPYTWTIGAQGGFKTASIKLRLSQTAAFQMLNDYIGKRIIFTHPAAPLANICWEGMINTITVDDGKVPVSRSIANTYNWVKVLYSTVDYTQATPVLGQQKQTSPAIDVDSRALYGQRELYYSAGGLSDFNAIYVREALYNKYRQPQTLATGTTTGGSVGIGDAEVTIDAVGYWETLDKRVYIDTFAVTPQPLDTLVSDIIDPGGGSFYSFISDDESQLVPNLLTQSPYQDKVLTIQNYLNKLCGFGHDTGSGYIAGPSFFGVYENRVPYYTPYPLDTSYIMRRLDPLERIFDAVTGAVVPPWLVRPARIVNMPDLLPSGINYFSDVDDVRSFVIGEVKFTSPNKVSFSPATDDPTQVILSRLGMGGL